jgi:hypothetical protein
MLRGQRLKLFDPRGHLARRFRTPTCEIFALSGRLRRG